MSDASDRVLALAELIDEVEPDAEPKLTPDELGAILDRTKRAQTWAANVELTTGVYVQPTVRNGLKYLVIKAGNTGPTEPNWPSLTSGWHGSIDGRTVTAGTATLQEAGDEFKNVYNVREAKYAAWSKKMSKASQFPKTSGVDMSVLFEHCKEKRNQFESVLVG